VAILSAQTRDAVDYTALAKIRDEGLNRSQVMEHIIWLSDVYGPRLTGTPALEEAGEWAMKRMTDWGLSNVHKERWAFGKGWSLARFSAHMVAPQVQPIIGYPASWTPGTKGPVTADVVRVQIAADSDFDRYRGKLAGTIVLLQPAREVKMLDSRIVLRMNDADIREAESTPIPPPRSDGGRGGQAQGPTLQQRIDQFLQAEGVVAKLDRGSDNFMSAGGSDLTWQTQRTDGGTVFPTGGGPRDENAGRGLPSATIAVEHYNRMIRLLERNVPVKVELNIEARFHDETTPNGFNVIAEIPGSDLRQEVVLIGGHLDSVAAATGATDNATGCAMMMEAMRIIMATGLKPRRTIRIGLWGGEEEGLLGSRAYVREHYGDPATMKIKPDHALLSAYFNADNGTGRIRGIWLQSNAAARPIFEQWMKPLADLGVTILGPRSVASTDHVSFDNVGLPAFQFVQERLEYNSRSHHSNMDFVDRVQRDDMVQAATVVAAIAYHAAMRDEKLPRKPLPRPAASGTQP
jgi:carboxypeptidase Q